MTIAGALPTAKTLSRALLPARSRRFNSLRGNRSPHGHHPPHRIRAAGCHRQAFGRGPASPAHHQRHPLRAAARAPGALQQRTDHLRTPPSARCDRPGADAGSLSLCNPKSASLCAPGQPYTTACRCPVWWLRSALVDGGGFSTLC